jgi:hypothetical protein
MGAVIHVEGPTEFVVRTRAGRKLKTCRSMRSAMNFAEGYLEKTHSRSLQVKGRFRYIPESVRARAAKRAKRRPAKRKRAKRRGRR